MPVKTRSSSHTLFWDLWTTLLNETPRRTVLIDLPSKRSVSYLDLHKQVDILYTRLHSQFNDISGQIVAYSLPNSVEWIALFLALQKAGASVLALDSSLSFHAAQENTTRMRAHYLWDHQSLSLKRLDSTRRRNNRYAIVKATSGSTGLPQPTFCRPDHLIADGKQIIDTMVIRKTDRNLGLIPLGHSYGWGNLIMPLLLQGTPIAVAPYFLPNQIPDWIKNHHLTVFPSVPAIFRILSEMNSIKTLHSLRLAISAGAPLPPETAQQFHHKFGLKLHNFYGSSETGGICYDRSGNASLTGRAIGKPMKGVSVQLSKSRSRIRVHSPAVSAPKNTFLLQDIGKWNQHQELQITGRTQKVVNIGGKKVHPEEIEAALKMISGVRETWIHTLQKEGREYLIAAVETDLKEKKLRHNLQKFLPDWKQPRFLYTTLSFPRTDRGKIDKSALQSLMTFWLNTISPSATT